MIIEGLLLCVEDRTELYKPFIPIPIKDISTRVIGKVTKVWYDGVHTLVNYEVDDSIVPNLNVDIDDMTPQLWNSMSRTDRHTWTQMWRLRGKLSFSCLNCGFPTAFGQVGCEACEPMVDIPIVVG